MASVRAWGRRGSPLYASAPQLLLLSAKNSRHTGPTLNPAIKDAGFGSMNYWVAPQRGRQSAVRSAYEINASLQIPCRSSSTRKPEVAGHVHLRTYRVSMLQKAGFEASSDHEHPAAPCSRHREQRHSHRPRVTEIEQLPDKTCKSACCWLYCRMTPRSVSYLTWEKKSSAKKSRPPSPRFHGHRENAPTALGAGVNIPAWKNVSFRYSSGNRPSRAIAPHSSAGSHLPQSTALWAT